MINSPAKTIVAVVAYSLTVCAPVLAQSSGGCDLSGSPRTDLRTPLIYGAPNMPPDQSAPPGQPPPVGNGSIPAPVTPGMGGPPTLIPSIPANPANNIDYPSYQIPYDPATQALPGQVGPGTWAPPPPSTPGCDPGIVQRPRDYIPPPARVGTVGPYGGIIGGAAGYRWGGQDTRDFGRYKHIGKRAFDFGQQEWGSTSQDGPCQTRPGSVAVQDLYGRRMPWRNNGAPIIQTIAPY